MRIELECTYCGRKWEMEIYNRLQVQGVKCKCGHTKLRSKDMAGKVDYYKGCPPFPDFDDDFYNEDDDDWRG